MELKFISSVSAYCSTGKMWDNGTTDGSLYYVGMLRFDVQNVTDGSPFEYLEGQYLDTFCADIYEGGTGWRLCQIKELKDLPIGTGTPMGEDRADLIAALYEKHWGEWESGTADQKKQKAAAFQAAMWEFGYEYYGDGSGIDWNAGANDFDDTGFDPGQTLDDGGVGDYGFYVYGANMNSTVLDYARTWMADAWKAWKTNDWSGTPLWGADAAGAQGVIVPIPLPAPLALASVGLLGVLAGRKRLAQLLRK
jgi:hypothetical protein